MLKNLLNRILTAPPAAPAPVAPASVAPTPAPKAAPAPALTTEVIAAANALIAEGNAQEDAGHLEQAEALYRSAIAKAPAHARGYLNLGIALAARGDGDGAARAYETVLAIDPVHPFGNYNLARLVFLHGDAVRAEGLLREALQARPEFAQALVLLSRVLESLGRVDPAVQALEQALDLQPADAGAWFNLALLRLKLGRREDCEVAVRKLLLLDPANAGGLALLSNLMRDHEFPSQVLELLQLAMRHDPTNLGYQSEALMLLNFEEGHGAAEVHERHVEFGARLEAGVPPRFAQFKGSRDPQRRLRVGYLSRDFCVHPVTIFLLPVLEHHDRAAIEIFCYWTGERSDHITRRVRDQSDRWVEASSLSDAELADAIHADAIDILVDLGGHTHDSRLGVFSQRPAPVQVSWLGYLNTTGLTRIDYRLCDRRTDPPESTQALHTERLFALPHSQWCYQPVLGSALVPTAPVEANGYVTFGSFNAGLKITPEMCRRWARVLAGMPKSRLLVADIKSERRRAAIRQEMAKEGIADDRVEFFPRVELDKYLQLFSRVDISLDTHPYGGGTTTFDSLWMGVPVVAAVGDIPVARSAASILATLGLQDWVAPSIADFVDVAVARASDHAAIAALRRSLRDRLKASPLTDLAGYTRDLEAAYRAMWVARCA